jgi:DNA-directed RNA polymerase subunit alpha
MFPINKFTIKTISETETEGIFQIGPLPKGYGNTVGTPFRRLLYSSIPGAAITSIRLEGAPHEYSTIAGIQDDALSIILALKDVALICRSDDPVTLKLQVKGDKKGPRAVTAADFSKDPMVDIVNPDHVITTLANEKASISAEVTVERGLGYALPKEELRNEVGIIPVDAIFTPVRLVSVNVTDTRVGQQTDLDLLEMRIVTNGTITPSAALSQAAEIFVKVSEHLFQSAQDLLSGKSKEQAKATLIPLEEDMEKQTTAAAPLLIDDMDISTRLRNALVNSGYNDLRQLDGLTEEELRNVKGMGEKSFEELQALIHKYDINVI